MSIHTGYGYLTQGIRIFRQCDEALPSHLAKGFCPESEVFLSHMNKRVDGFIFSHLNTIYLSDSFAHVRYSYLTWA